MCQDKDISETRRKVQLILCFVGLMLALSSCKSANHKVINVAVTVCSDRFRYVNTLQTDTQIQMQAINGDLYVYLPAGDKTDSAVYVFGQAGASKLDALSSFMNASKIDKIRAFGNGYLYAGIQKSVASEKAELLCYNLRTSNSGVILSTENAPYLNTVFDENGTLYVTSKEISSNSGERFQIIQGDTLLSGITEKPEVPVGTFSEVLKRNQGTVLALTEGQIGDVIESAEALEIKYGACISCPCVGGCLIYTAGKTPICFLSTDGTVMPLLQYDCLFSASCFNFNADYAYLSLKRYEKWDKWYFGMLPYEDDSISGTYRVSLTDLTIEKVSDTYYKALFIFDDASIFACGQYGSVYQYSPEWNLIATLVAPER